MAATRAPYTPALGYHWLTVLYDPVLRVTMREEVFKRRLIDAAKIEDGHRVLDLGCGTGTLSAMIAARHGRVELVAVDPDGRVLEIAAGKTHPWPNVRLVRTFGWPLPLADASVDRVVSSLVFHHLDRAGKLSALREAYRVLKPGGEIHIADFGRPNNRLMRGLAISIQLVDGFVTTRDNLEGALPGLVADAGFVSVRQTARFATVGGTLELLQGCKRA